MNKKTVALTDKQYVEIIKIIMSGFVCKDGHVVKPNNRIATALVLEGNLGIRISDILKLSLQSIVHDGNRYRLDIVEKKTGKKREFTVPLEIYAYMQKYAIDNNIGPAARLFPISERAVQKHLKLACDYLGLINVSTHSFRKYFGTNIYEENGHDINLVRVLYQHSSVVTTQIYIGVSPDQIENALQKHVKLL